MPNETFTGPDPAMRLAAAGAPPSPEAPGAGPEGRDGAAFPARILIVEDEAIIAWELAATVEELGYEVCGTALNAAEAVRLAAEMAPDLVLMDIRLGRGGDGVEVAAILRAATAPASVPVLFCTAHAHDPRTIARVEAVGGVGLIAKPIEPGLLARHLGRLLPAPAAPAA